VRFVAVHEWRSGWDLSLASARGRWAQLGALWHCGWVVRLWMEKAGASGEEGARGFCFLAVGASGGVRALLRCCVARACVVGW
jgi:hypothetical protein